MNRFLSRTVLFLLTTGMYATSIASTLLDIHFSETEGFTDGAAIHAVEGFDAQTGWIANDTTNSGYASYDGGWQRARNLTDYTMEIGGSVQIQTTLRLSSAAWSDSDVYKIGFAINTENAGGATPSIGSQIHANNDGSYWFGNAEHDAQRIQIPAGDASDWITFVQTITRSATSNQFTGSVSAYNLTDRVNLGTAEPWTQTTDDGSWGGTMNPGFRGTGTPGITLDIDRWIVKTIAPPTDVTATIDLTRRRSIGGITSLDRETWFGTYHETGYGSKVIDGKAIDEWIYEEGRMWPSRGTIGYGSFAEDPARPSYIDPAAISNLTGALSRYVTANAYDPDHKTVFSGRGHGDYPDYMCWPTTLTHGVNTVSNHVAHGEAVVRTFDRITELGGLLPTWYEVTNESSIQSNFGWHWDSDAWDKLAEYHNAVADAMNASVYSNAVKVAGPTDAYPFRDGTDGDFSQWENFNKKFVSLSGDKMGAYAMHTYEQMNGETSYEDSLERYEVWHLGRLPAFVDLWENEQFNTWSNTLPFVFSEYGLLNNPEGDQDAFWQLRSCNGILLSLLDRPDVIDKMSPFLLSWAPYNLDNDRVFFGSDDDGSTFHKTSYFEYLRFWHDLEGDYLFSNTDSSHLDLHAFLSEGTNLLVVMQNNYKDPYTVDLKATLPAGASVASARMQKLSHAAIHDVQRDPFEAVSDLGNIEMGADETVMLKIALDAMPELNVWNESNHYGDRTLVPMQTGTSERFEFNLPETATEIRSAGRVTLGLYAFNGFTTGLQQISVNGTALNDLPDLSYTEGAPRHWANVSLNIPAGILKNGTNIVAVTPAEGDELMKITSVRLTSESVSAAVLNQDRDLDGIPDAWEIENGLDASDFADGALDTDSDGVDNFSEYICGTDPRDTQSVFTIRNSSMSKTGFTISFDSESNRIYAIETTDDLRMTGSWVDWTNQLHGTGELIEMTDLNEQTNRFYRIRVEVKP